MRRHVTPGMQVSITDVTSGYAQINLQGPRSRELLQTLTSADLSNDAFPFRTAREIDVGSARVLCVRITYVGELGYELYVPAEQSGGTPAAATRPKDPAARFTPTSAGPGCARNGTTPRAFRKRSPPV